jgi:hypothetical protein
VQTGSVGTSGFNWSDTLRIGHDFTGEIRDVKVFEDTGATQDEVNTLFCTPPSLLSDIVLSLPAAVPSVAFTEKSSPEVSVVLNHIDTTLLPVALASDASITIESLPPKLNVMLILMGWSN